MKPCSVSHETFERARAPLVEALAAAAARSMAEEMERAYLTVLALDYPRPLPAPKPTLRQRLSWKWWNLRRKLALRIDPTLLEEVEDD